MTQRYSVTTVNGHDVFYRESGPADAPVVVLLHGFPSSSHMFRELIPKLSDQYRVVAPDLVGFGYSAQPAATDFEYTFDNVSAIVERFLLDVLKLSSFSLYLHDYGAPVGFRIAARHPDTIDALVVQNGNAYVEGFSDAWAPIRALWRERHAASEAGVRELPTSATTKFQYTHGVADVDRISPDAYTLDQSLLDRPGNADVQVALFADYQTNVARYPEWQAYFRRHQPPMLIVWGARDPFFTVDGARAFTRDLPHAELHLLDTGHFALEDHVDAIAARMRTFLDGVHRSREQEV
jgi:pimeloyl-ACP methyl ester carboxylesterase